MVEKTKKNKRIHVHFVIIKKNRKKLATKIGVGPGASLVACARLRWRKTQSVGPERMRQNLVPRQGRGCVAINPRRDFLLRMRGCDKESKLPFIPNYQQQEMIELFAVSMMMLLRICRCLRYTFDLYLCTPFF